MSDDILAGKVGEKIDAKDLGPEVIGKPLFDQLNEPKTQFVLRIIVYDSQGTVTANNAFPLRPEHWKTDVDSLSGMLVGFTNEMKMRLKEDGFVMRKHDSGTVEYILQEGE